MCLCVCQYMYVVVVSLLSLLRDSGGSLAMHWLNTTGMLSGTAVSCVSLLTAHCSLSFCSICPPLLSSLSLCLLCLSTPSVLPVPLSSLPVLPVPLSSLPVHPFCPPGPSVFSACRQYSALEEKPQGWFGAISHMVGRGTVDVHMHPTNKVCGCGVV